MSDSIRFELPDGFELAGTDVEQLWWRYLGNGGEGSPDELADRITGSAPCDETERDLIAQTLNECFLDRGLATFPVGYTPRLTSSSGPRGHLERLRAKRPVPVRPAPLRPDINPAAPQASTWGPSTSAARHRVAEAQRRSAVAARQAAALHLTAARLMHDSGQLAYARHAGARAISAQHRAEAHAALGPERSPR